METLGSAAAGARPTVVARAAAPASKPAFCARTHCAKVAAIGLDMPILISRRLLAAATLEADKRRYGGELPSDNDLAQSLARYAEEWTARLLADLRTAATRSAGALARQVSIGAAAEYDADALIAVSRLALAAALREQMAIIMYGNEPPADAFACPGHDDLAAFQADLLLADLLVVCERQAAQAQRTTAFQAWATKPLFRTTDESISRVSPLAELPADAPITVTRRQLAAAMRAHLVRTAVPNAVEPKPGTIGREVLDEMTERQTDAFLSDLHAAALQQAAQFGIAA